MKKNEKNKYSILIYVLTMTSVMFNCKKDVPFPTSPDNKLVDELKKVKITPIAVAFTLPVAKTPGKIEPNVMANALWDDVAKVPTTGTVTTTITTAVDVVTASLSPDEIAKLAAVPSETIEAIIDGGAIPADLKALVDKVATIPAIQAYMPTYTPPTVDRKPVNARVAAIDQESDTRNVEAVLVDDACITAANAEFQNAKTRLDSDKAAVDLQITNTYNAAASQATLAIAELDCQAAATSDIKNYINAFKEKYLKARLTLNEARAILSPSYFRNLSALLNYWSIYHYQLALKWRLAGQLSCRIISETTISRATFTRDTNLAREQANYDAAIAKANELKTELIQSCHNQGSGN